MSDRDNFEDAIDELILDVQETCAISEHIGAADTVFADARARVLALYDAAQDCIPDCDGCAHLGSTDPAAIIACRYCPRSAVYHDHYEPKGGDRA